MNRYVAFLRGINIGGKNKIAMPDLKAEFEALGFSDVVTVLNSGNVVFSSEGDVSRDVLAGAISKRFALDVPVYAIPLETLRDVVAHAPAWWNSGDKARYDNLIFILSGESAEEIRDQLGEPSEGLETVWGYGNAIFGTFDRKRYQKCNWWKRTAGAGIASKLTIRTANTVLRICK